jgi:hypothetical protein
MLELISASRISGIWTVSRIPSNNIPSFIQTARCNFELLRGTVSIAMILHFHSTVN